MPSETLAQLRNRVEALEAQNAELTGALVAERAQRVEASIPPGSSTPSGRSWGGRHRTRTATAWVLVVLGLLLAPAAMLVQYAHTTLTDTDGFVATFAPLANDPDVQTAVSAAVVQAIQNSVDVDGATQNLFSGLETLPLSDAAKQGLGLLEGPAIDGIHALLSQLVTGFVQSDAFADVWRQTLQLTHQQLNATLSGDSSAVVGINGDDVSINLAPVIATVKQNLVSSGVGFASLIPDDIQATVDLGTVSGIGQLRVLYGLVGALAIWLPILATVFVLGGIAVGVNRRRWIFGTGLTVTILMVVIGIAIGVGRVVTQADLPFNDDAEGTVFDAATAQLTSVVITWSILGFVAAAGAFVLGFRTPAAKAGEWLSEGAGWLRGRLVRDERGEPDEERVEEPAGEREADPPSGEPSEEPSPPRGAATP